MAIGECPHPHLGRYLFSLFSDDLKEWEYRRNKQQGVSSPLLSVKGDERWRTGM